MIRDYIICTFVATAFWLSVTVVIVSNGWVQGNEAEFMIVTAPTTIMVSGVAYLLERFVFKNSVEE